MKQEITVPQMGESITEATIGAILKENGTAVRMDEEILELETDKVNQVLYAPCAGTVELTVQVDDVVGIGQIVGFVDGNGQGAAPAPSAPAAEEKPEQKVEARAESTPTPPAAPVSANGKGIRQTREAYVADLNKPAPAAPVSAPAPAASQGPQVPAGERVTRKRMTKLRQVIASKLVEVQQNTAMLTTFNEVDMSSVMALRGKYKEAFEKQHDARLGFLSFFVKAVVGALKAFPDINAVIEGNEILQRRYYDIGIAVGTDRGLVVPVLCDCDEATFAGLEGQIANFAKKARDGSMSIDDLQGGTFTITNGGVYGSMLSTPILNQGQSGILGMHNIVKRPVVVDGEIVVRPIMYLALSYDHRVVDGKEAVSFLVHVKNSLEDPARLMLDV